MGGSGVKNFDKRPDKNFQLAVTPKPNKTDAWLVLDIN